MTVYEEQSSGSLLRSRDHWLKDYDFGLRLVETGHVISVGDGITWVSGLPSAGIDDILQFEDGSRAMVFDLNDDRVGAVLLKQTHELTAGIAAHRTPHSLSIPVGDGLLGRVIDPMGLPLDGKEGLTDVRNSRRIDIASPPITARDFVHDPLYTGNKIVDTMIPIGKGQRQLIIGDEGLGRSSLALDAVINQRGKDVHCIYVLISQRRSSIVNTIALLRDYGAMDYTTVVVGEASALPGLQHLAPFAGCSIAEYWMEQGRDTLIVYDDLSAHARTYRELSLLLRRPPGREAYPGDIFSVHARLLERSTCLNAEQGGGSMTAFPIVETHEGEIADYIPTNLISITDGQIYLDRDLFTGGFRPAIDIGKSVSRIGGQAQHPRIKEESGRMKFDYLQYLELESFTRFGAKLEAGMQKTIKRGRLLREILKQDLLDPVSIEFDMAWLVAFNEGRFDEHAPEEVGSLLEDLARALKAYKPELSVDRRQWLQLVDGCFSVGGEKG